MILTHVSAARSIAPARAVFSTSMADATRGGGLPAAPRRPRRHGQSALTPSAPPLVLPTPQVNLIDKLLAYHTFGRSAPGAARGTA